MNYFKVEFHHHQFVQGREFGKSLVLMPQLVYAKSTMHAVALVKAGYPQAINVSAHPLVVEGD